MSRETYFRAWDTYNEAWADEYLAIAEDGHVIEIKNDGTTEYWKDRFIIEFDTGLKDKNGKKICEGDIVRYFDNGGQINEAVVKQKDGDTENSYWITGIVYEHLRIVCEEDLIEEDYENLCGFEIIGNIHENPELLKGEE